MSNKGPPFERWLAKELSLWWSYRARDDCFWRTSGSGSRATGRARKGRKTAGGYGDIAATDAEGIPFLKVFTVEVKRGYSRHTLQDLIDRPRGKTAKQLYEKWLIQAAESADSAGSMSWLIVLRRDHREPLAMLPADVLEALGGLSTPCPTATYTPVSGRPVVIVHLDDLFTGMDPDRVREATDA